MRAKIAAAVYKTSGDNYEIEFSDKPALDFAADLLRRQGLARGLEVDAVKLTVRVPADLTDANGQDAKKLLKG